jgi:biopolymer transport protein ExbD
MRFVALAVAMVLLAGCKDKAKKPAATDHKGSGLALPKPTYNAPSVTGPGVEPAKPLSVMVFYSKSEISIGEEPAVDLGTDGLISQDLMDKLAISLEEKVRSDDPVGIALDGNLAYVRVVAFLTRLKRAGFRNIVLLTRERGQIPIVMPDPSELGGPRLHVNVASNMINLYSVTGEEGTVGQPKLSIPVSDGTKKLTEALAEIVTRRWPTGTRTPPELTITLQFEHTETATMVMRIIAAVRADSSRTLFPSVFLTGVN